MLSIVKGNVAVLSASKLTVNELIPFSVPMNVNFPITIWPCSETVQNKNARRSNVFILFYSPFPGDVDSTASGRQLRSELEP
jgi:hypothetical protein